MRPAHGMWTSSCADNQRRPLVPAFAGTGLDEVPLGGADRVTIDAAGADLVSPASLDGVVDADDHGGIGAEQAGDQQAQQPPCDRARRPHRSVQDAMVDREVGLLLAPKNTQRRSDGSFAGRQDGTGQQEQGVAPGRACEQIGQACQPQQQTGRQRRYAGCRRRIGLFHPMRRIDPVESQQAPARPVTQKLPDCQP
jgi:hypothetical protein